MGYFEEFPWFALTTKGGVSGEYWRWPARPLQWEEFHLFAANHALLWNPALPILPAMSSSRAF